MVITIYGKLPSWNTLYSGVHWSERSGIAHLWHALVREALDHIEGGDELIPYPPVSITVHAYYKGKGFDPDNVCAKLVIDGLKGRVISDDSSAYVSSVTTTSSSKCKEDKVVIILADRDDIA